MMMISVVVVVLVCPQYYCPVLLIGDVDGVYIFHLDSSALKPNKRKHKRDAMKPVSLSFVAIVWFCPQIAGFTTPRDLCRIKPINTERIQRYDHAPSTRRDNAGPLNLVPDFLSADLLHHHSHVFDSLPSLSLSSSVNVADSSVAVQAAAEKALNSLGRDVLIFLGATVVVVPLSRVIGITPVLTFLVAGCLLGPHGLGLFSNNEADIELGNFGILFLLFSEGLNLSPEKIRDLGAFGALGIFQILSISPKDDDRRLVIVLLL